MEAQVQERHLRVLTADLSQNATRDRQEVTWGSRPRPAGFGGAVALGIVAALLVYFGYFTIVGIGCRHPVGHSDPFLHLALHDGVRAR